MAKSKQDPDAILLLALRKALNGPMPMFAAPKMPGLFAKKEKPLAERAVAENLLEEFPETLPPAGKAKKGKEVILGRITGKGRQRILDVDSPKQVLESLVPALQSLSNHLAPPIREGGLPSAKIEEVAHKMQLAFHDGISELRKTVHRFMDETDRILNGIPVAIRAELQLPARKGSGITEEQFGSLLGLLETTASAVKGAIEKRDVVPPSAVHEAAAPSSPAIADEIIRRVGRQREINRLHRFTLTHLFNELRLLFPALLLSHYHDALRALQEQRKIILLPFTQPFTEMSEPQAALFLDREVKYYVDLP